MRAALSLARRGLGSVAPNPSVGCILVKDNKVIGRGRTAESGRPHAEAAALAHAGSQAKDATAYITLEPCAVAGREGPCAEALVKAGIKRAVVACIDPNPVVLGRGLEILKHAGVEVVLGVLEKQAQDLNKGFFLTKTEQRPMVTLKVAATKDNKIAPVSGERLLISGAMALRYLHLLRSRHDAILVGIGTVLKDDPLLTTRLEGVTHKIIRIVLDSHLKIPLESKLVKTAQETPLWVFYEDDPENKAGVLIKKGVKLFQETKLRSVLKRLAEQGVTRLLVEGGAQIHAAFVKEGIGDSLLWSRSPRVLGAGLAAFGGMNADEVAGRLSLEHVGTRIRGEDLLEIYEKQA